MSSLRNLGNDGRRPAIQNSAVEISISGILGEEDREVEEREAKEREAEEREAEEREAGEDAGEKKTGFTGRLERVWLERV